MPTSASDSRSQIAQRFGYRPLDLADVVGDARHQAAHRLRREKRGRLTEDVAEELVAQVAHDPLADTGHQVLGEVRADALEKVERENAAIVGPTAMLFGRTSSTTGRSCQTTAGWRRRRRPSR